MSDGSGIVEVLLAIAGAIGTAFAGWKTAIWRMTAGGAFGKQITEDKVKLIVIDAVEKGLKKYNDGRIQDLVRRIEALENDKKK